MPLAPAQRVSVFWCREWPRSFGLKDRTLHLGTSRLAGIALPMADTVPLFLYVSRPVVVLVGLLLILAAILLIVLGRGVSGLAGYLAHREVSCGTP